MKLCIAEKPSVARDIAEVIGAKQRHDGYYEENWKYWRLEDLPMIPEKFGIKLIEDQGVKRQFSVIEKLVAQCEEVINCGDAGQEGELIQRWVLAKAKCKVPIKRLWISSLTEEA